MSARIPNLVYAAIYRAKSRDPLASNPRYYLFTPAKAHVVVVGLAVMPLRRIAPGSTASSASTKRPSDCDRHPMNLQELANQIRETPLCDLLQWHGFEIKSEGVSFRAKNDHHNIVVTGNRWFENKAGLGGVGAIDLQMHLTDEDFAAACQTLARDFRGPSIGEIRLSFPIERHIPISAGAQALSRIGGEIRRAKRSELADCP